MIEEISARGAQRLAPRIVIIGANRMLNDLVAFFLTSKAGRECHALASLKEMEEAANAVRVIIHDCGNFSPEQIKALCRGCKRDRVVHDLHVLFNMARTTGVEQEVMELGVRGIFYTQDSAESLGQGIEVILNRIDCSPGQMPGASLTPCPRRGTATAGIPRPLSAREVEILAMISAGLTNESIAERLYISTHTVRTHLYNIFRKIEVHNRLQAALWATKNINRERLTT